MGAVGLWSHGLLIIAGLATPPGFSAPWGFVDGKGLPEVYSLIYPSLTRPPGLATPVGATQSSEAFRGSPGRAIDGNGDGDYFHNSATHTNLQAAPWWKADLGQVSFVAAVDVYNRPDCCADRLTNFNVDVSQDGTSWIPVANFPGQAGSPTTIPVNRDARYVRIQLVGTNYLSLAEVSIWLK